MKAYWITAALLLSAASATAQDQSWKKGVILNGDQPVARIEDVKVKGQGLKNYVVLGNAGDTLIHYTLRQASDTLGSAAMKWYEVRMPQAGIQFTRPPFTAMFNTNREIGEELIRELLIMPDGTLSSEGARTYAEAFPLSIPDLFQRRQDSLVQLISRSAPPIERDRSKAITANELGKIGQGNTVIGYWEVHSQREPISTLTFIFKNLQGGIVSVNHATISGIPNAYIFVNGVRSKETNSAFSYPPGSDQIAYVQKVAQWLVRKGLL